MPKYLTEKDNPKRYARCVRFEKRHGFSPDETWGLDHTIAEFVLPRLKYFRKNLHGCPADFCQGTRNSARWHQNWEHTLDKMIWSFEQIIDDDDERKFFTRTGPMITKKTKTGGTKYISTGLKIDRAGLNKHHKKIQEGLELFGKYFQNLWD